MRALAPLRALARSATILVVTALGFSACGAPETLPIPGESTTTTSGTSSTDAIETGPWLEGDCDPIVATRCGLPFPSNVYLADDPSTATGKRVAFGKTSLPRLRNKKYVDPSAWNDSDGFSPGQAPFTHMLGATIAGFPTQDNIEFSLTENSPTVLIYS